MLFAPRRAVRCAGPFAAILAVTAVLAGALAASTALADRLLDDGTARLVAAADPIDRSIVVDAPADAQDAPDTGAQSPGAQKVVDAAVVHAFEGTSVDVVRTVQTTAMGGSLGTVLLLGTAGVEDRAALVAGAWPAGDAEVAVAARAAGRTGLAPGDTITVDGAPVTVSGVWRATDAAATAWAGMPAVTSGRQDDAIGPLLGDAALVGRDGARARWTISADGPVTAGEIAGYRAGIARLQSALDGVEGLDYRIDGGWDATLARAASADAVAHGVLSVPLALVAVVGLLALGVLAHAAGRRRAGDILLLRARGAARTAVVAETAGVVAVVGVAAAAIGTGAAFALGVGPVAAVGIPAATAAIALVLVTVVAAAAALAPPRTRADVNRRSIGGVAGGLALAAVFAAVAVAQLLTSGLLRDGTTDAAAAAAPALALIAAALAAALLAGPAAAVAERLVRGIPSLPPVLAVRRIARQAAVVVAGVLSLSLAAGGLAFALTATTRAAGMAETDIAHAVGADVRAVYDRSPIVDADHPAMSAAGTPDAFAVFASPATAGQTPVSLVGMPATRLARQIDAPAAELGPVHPLRLDGTLQLALTAAMADGGTWPGGTVTVSAWLVDRDGAARVQRIGDAPVDGHAHRLGTAVPGGLSLAAIELTTASAPGTVSAQARIAGAPGPLSLSVDPGSARARGMTVTGISRDIPVAVTRTLAERLALRPGAALSVGLGTLAQPLAGRVVAVRDWLPGVGTGAGVAVDLDGLVAGALRLGGSVPAAGELWADTAHVAATSAALRAVAEQPVRVLTVPAAGTAAVITPALVLTAIGVGVVALLAAAAFAAVAAGVVRDRRDEAVPLRAFGFTPARMRATAALELSGAAAFALVCGVAAGIAIAAWLGPALLAGVAVGSVS